MKQPKMSKNVERIANDLSLQGNGIIIAENGSYSLPAEIEDYSPDEIQEVKDYFNARKEYLNEQKTASTSSKDLLNEVKSELIHSQESEKATPSVEF